MEISICECIYIYIYIYIYTHSIKENKILHFKRFIAQRLYTVCIKMNYKIVPVTNWNMYFKLWYEWK